MDGDGSFDPDELAPLLDDVRAGRADMAVGRRRPAGRGVWPWHARAGNALVVAWLRHRIGMPAHDIAPMRVCRPPRPCSTWASATARFGYPVELLQRAVAAGWRFAEHDVTYHPRAAGTRSKVSGLGDRHAADGPRLRAGAAMTAAPVLRRRQGARSPASRRPASAPRSAWTLAAELAAAALLDTLRHLCGDRRRGPLPARARRATSTDAAYADRAGRRARGLARLPAARRRAGRAAGALHLDLAAEDDGPVVQIGMDTPQVTAADLARGDRRPRRRRRRAGRRRGRWLVGARR